MAEIKNPPGADRVATGPQLAEQYRLRAENLMALAMETSSSVGLPEFVKNFLARACAMMRAQSAALALAEGKTLETVAVHGFSPADDKAAMRNLNLALAELADEPSREFLHGPARQILGETLAVAFGWSDVTLAWLKGSDRTLLGVVLLADRGSTFSRDDENLLQALAAHAAVALENSRLFTKIAQASRHWHDIFDAISDLIVVHDDGNRVLRVNRSMADVIGSPPHQLIGLNMGALIAGLGGPQGCQFCRAKRDGIEEYVHPDLKRAYLVSTSGIQGAINEGQQTIHVLKDVTDRREAELRYRELFDNIQEGLFFSTPSGRFLQVNSALVRMLGYESREELLNTDIPKNIYMFPDQRRRFTQQMEETGALRNFEETLRRKDGSLVHTLQNAFAVRDAGGETVQYRGLILDITEQKTVQAQLQRERDFNIKILDNTQSMILVADTAGLVSYANRRCFDSGDFRASQLIGRRLSEIVAHGRRREFADAFEATVLGEQSENLELPIVRGDGDPGHFSVSLSPMRDEQGNVTSVVVVMTDITDAALLQAKLINTEKLAAVGQLVSGVAHEVNNPLTAILGFADLLLDTPGLSAEAQRDLNVIIQEAQRTKLIVQNLLSFARQVPQQRKAIQLNCIVERTLQLRGYDLANHGVEVVQRLDSRLPEVVGDEHQLQQVFLNILNNAYDATRESGNPRRIEVSSIHSQGSVEVSFKDSGNGISDPEKIFDPFFTTKEVGKGTGLGLSICYGIVNEHKGEIIAKNNSPETGATFTVRLPVAGKMDRELAAATGAQS
jgi:PAS domain S-box-containing protein